MAANELGIGWASVWVSVWALQIYDSTILDCDNNLDLMCVFMASGGIGFFPLYRFTFWPAKQVKGRPLTQRRGCFSAQVMKTSESTVRQSPPSLFRPRQAPGCPPRLVLCSGGVPVPPGRSGGQSWRRALPRTKRKYTPPPPPKQTESGVFKGDPVLSLRGGMCLSGILSEKITQTPPEHPHPQKTSSVFKGPPTKTKERGVRGPRTSGMWC